MTTSFLHDGTIGDIWASLPAVRQNYRKTGKKAIYYLTNGQAATYYDGAVHPTKNADGVEVMLNEQVINMMIPLLNAQPYIEDARIHNEEPIDIDLNRIRHTFVNMPNHMLSRWYFYVFPDLACNLAETYIEVPETNVDYAIGKVIVSRTQRYPNPQIKYSFLNEYEGSVIFSGLKKEYNLFCMDFDLNIPRMEISDFLQLAQALKQAKGLVSNQTMIFQIAEGLKTPRAVELCSIAPNVTPIGDDAYDFYAQSGAEYYFNKLDKFSKYNGSEQEYIKKVIEKQKLATQV